MSSKMIFINLPVRELSRSKDFYQALGWKLNEDFTDDNAACIVVDDNICLMLLTRQYFQTFTKRPVAETTGATGAAYALSLGSAAEVDALTEAALAAGGSEEVNEDKRAQEAEVGMHGRTFLDPDGHQWEPFWMDYPGGA
ncbi:glyoxalase/bleomycin resistance/extradiol dioxygenase family protein [Nocardia farcinica]|uniref:VOC domain-containing protein n=2 Tax=Nocardia farcinica TaxID=37329 RepID=Q5Z2G9_NOCFA|nr:MULTISPECIES: VOC family protein [Nocardia]AXK86733.1 glyoxalase/bleomycin resistance/extradiol dioxygenase family protein [Nocardia farcinica]MBA4857122.1 glyoxalase/bleomycin resistance/extradiol dioxygenase family protein [Nocardia farcinica]MBC9817199.1 glyoxalase/bleomycin resistance/extradiol dioxygenase family protein [Nocardia farcinica]MBF6070317.1 glyoxalase/bleomycin resistance/extradiol dioxygenase family protein [Nocardia farcinica]MBF6138864.1 glyoxalase/bleomycin resistance/e